MSDLTLYPELEQRTPEWIAARLGIVTASTVGRLIERRLRDGTGYTCSDCGAKPGEPCVSKARKTPAPIKTVHHARVEKAAAAGITDLVPADSDTSRGLILTLAAERITGHIEETPISRDMWRGIEDEPVARDAYSEHHAPVDLLGFMVREVAGVRIGYSPDGLVGDAGLIEIKSRLQKRHLQTILDDEVPAENMAQLQAGLLVSGRSWIDYVSYCGGMPLWTKRVEPDPAWGGAIIAAAKAAEIAITTITRRYMAATDGLPMTERLPSLDEIRI